MAVKKEKAVKLAITLFASDRMYANVLRQAVRAFPYGNDMDAFGLGGNTSNKGYGESEQGISFIHRKAE